MSYTAVGLLLVLSYAHFCVQVAREAKQIWGIPIGHERAVAINKVLHVPGMIRRGANWFGQSHTFLALLRVLGGSKSQDSWNRAQEYYDSQRDAVLQRAINWELHKSLEPMENEVYDDITFYDIIAVRANVFYANLKEHGWMDFAIEKNKCQMYRFIKNNGFPHCSILKEWDDLTKFANEAELVMQDERCEKYSCFAKMCHITMGHLNSAVRIKKEKTFQDYVQWASHLWNKRPIDWDRTWGPTFDKLTDMLKPGVMIQEGYSGGRKGGKDSPIELKVEVVWGHAYLAFVTMGIHDCGNPIILRNGDVIEYQMKNFFIAEPEKCHRANVVDKGFMDVVWHLAEAFAAATAFDSIRVDIFVPESGDPRNAVVNEISLSSGAGYAWHWNFFTKLWVEGYKARRLLRESGKTPPVSRFDVTIDKINRGEDFYAKQYSQCNTTLVSEAQVKRYCY